MPQIPRNTVDRQPQTHLAYVRDVLKTEWPSLLFGLAALALFCLFIVYAPGPSQDLNWGAVLIVITSTAFILAVVVGEKIRGESHRELCLGELKKEQRREERR